MNAETMTINPNELVIDLPVDDAHVQELMTSLQKNGRMVEPVTVWLQGMRIINGFHRTEAAKRLGWESMPCLIQDLTEDEFWDARIIAAKPHKEVEPERMAAWMLESWRNSFGLNSINVDALNELLDRFGITDRLSEEQLQMIALVDALDSYESGDEYINSRRVFAGEEKVEDGFTKSGRKRFVTRQIWEKRGPTEFEQWFESKADRWGVPVKTIASSIEKTARKVVGIQYKKEPYNNWRIEYETGNWSRKELPLVEYIARLEAKKRYEQYTPKWASDVARGAAAVTDIGVYAQEEKEKLAELDRQRDERARRKLEAYETQKLEKDQKLMRQLEEDQKARDRTFSTPKWRLQALHSILHRARYELNSIATEDLPEAPAMIAEFAQFVADFSAKHFPDMQVAQPNPVALENSRLRAENAKLKERIASLERALGSKQAAGEMLSSAMAWSSGDLER